MRRVVLVTVLVVNEQRRGFGRLVSTPGQAEISHVAWLPWKQIARVGPLGGGGRGKREIGKSLRPNATRL